MNLFDYISANTPRNTRPKVSPARVINEGLLNPTPGNIDNANRFKDSAFGLLGIVPGVGDYASGVQAADFYNRGEMGNAALAGLGALPLVPAMHTVYHGSPHKFDKFDMSKIGTGEGAQAYGHGLYFAEAPNVAKSYIPANAQAQETITGLLKKETARAKRYANEGGMEVYEMFQKGYTPAGIRQNIDNLIESGEAHPAYIKKMEQAYKKATEIYQANPAGSMYKVDIPDESIPRMLDWDAGGEQYYRDIVNEAGRGIRDRTGPYWDMIKDDPNRLMYRPGDIASMALRQQGIPGIKYFDGLSRGDKGGTRNFVLFDDQLPRILEVNGKPTGLLSYADEAKKAKK